MRISFFRTGRPKQFNYIPRYYDEQKEEAEERKKRIEQELGTNDTGAYRNTLQRGAMSRRFSERKKANRTSTLRLLIIITILILLTLYLLSGNISFKF